MQAEETLDHSLEAALTVYDESKMLIFQSNLKPEKSLCEQNKFTAKHDDVTKLAALVTQR